MTWSIPRPVDIYRWFRAKLGRLRELEGGPHAVSLGIGIGCFVGFLPLLGLKTLLAMGLAKLLRGNVIAAAIAVTLHDIILPIDPFLMIWEYDIGYRLVGHLGHFPAPSDWHHHHAGIAMVSWKRLLSLEVPFLVGGVALGAPVGLAGYLIARVFLRPRPGDAAESPAVPAS